MSGISFKIAAPPRPSSAPSARPSAPPSRPSNRNGRSHQQDEDDSDSDDGLASKSRRTKDELVTGFDSDGITKYVHLSLERAGEQPAELELTCCALVNRKHKEQKAAPLVIPSLPNKDWRKAAEQAGARKGGKKKREMYIPDAVGGMRVGGPAPADGSQGGMGTRDVINSTPVVGGLAFEAKKEAAEGEVVAMEVDQAVEVPEDQPKPEARAPETEEQRALRELMSGGASAEQAPSVDIIHSAADARGVLGEAVDDSTSTFQRDVHSRPDEASLDDYARVPVGEFGAAMLRGMGWKPGQAASRNGRKGPTEAFVPKSRPAMLGIGAKPMADVLGPEDKKGGPKTSRREDMKFMPLLKKEREGSASASGRSVSLMLSRLPSPKLTFSLSTDTSDRRLRAQLSTPVRPVLPHPLRLPSSARLLQSTHRLRQLLVLSPRRFRPRSSRGFLSSAGRRSPPSSG